MNVTQHLANQMRQSENWVNAVPPDAPDDIADAIAAAEVERQTYLAKRLLAQPIGDLADLRAFIEALGLFQDMNGGDMIATPDGDALLLRIREAAGRLLPGAS